MFNTNRQLKRQMPPTGQQLQKIIRLLIFTFNCETNTDDARALVH